MMIHLLFADPLLDNNFANTRSAINISDILIVEDQLV